MNRTVIAIVIICILLMAPISSCIVVYERTKDFVDITISISGLPIDKQKVRLTKQQADEIEFLFDNLNSNLKQANSMNESRDLFKEMIVKLDKYKLLGDLSVEQAQKLVTGENKICNLLLRNNHIKDVEPSFNGNRFSFIVGESTEEYLSTWFTGLPFRVAYTLNWILLVLSTMQGLDSLASSTLVMLTVLTFIFLLKTFNLTMDTPYGRFFDPFFQLPYIFGGSIYYGYQLGYYDYFPSEGWVTTYGVNGMKNWSGYFYGNFSNRVDILLLNPPLILDFIYTCSYPGVSGFFGLIFDYEVENIFYGLYPRKYIGFALKTDIGYEPPYSFWIEPNASFVNYQRLLTSQSTKNFN